MPTAFGWEQQALLWRSSKGILGTLSSTNIGMMWSQTRLLEITSWSKSRWSWMRESEYNKIKYNIIQTTPNSYFKHPRYQYNQWKNILYIISTWRQLRLKPCAAILLCNKTCPVEIVRPVIRWFGVLVTMRLMAVCFAQRCLFSVITPTAKHKRFSGWMCVTHCVNGSDCCFSLVGWTHGEVTAHSALWNHGNNLIYRKTYLRLSVCFISTVKWLTDAT